MSQPKTRSDHPYGAKPPYVPPPGPFYSQASMSQNESSAFPGSSSFPPSRSAENTRRPSRPVGAFVDANEEVLPNIPGRSGFPSGPVHTNPPGRTPSHHDVQSRQQAELQIRQQANTHHQYEANAQSQLHQDQHHAEYPIQGRTHSSNRSQPSRPDHGSSSGFPAVGAGQAPLKPALKKTQPSSAEDFIKIKQENIDQSPAMVQPTRGYTSVIENTYILPKASPIQERSTHEHPQHQSSNSDPRQLKRESSMPPLGRSSFYEEQEEDVQSTAYDTPEPRGRRRTGRQDQRTDSKPTLGTSVKMGRSKSVINEGGSQRNNVRSSAYQAQDQGERQEFSPSENASFYNPDNEFGSIHQSIEEVLYSARDHYDELRIKEQWYPRAIGCRDQEIARLVGTNGELEQRVRGLIAAKARSEANAKREVEKAHAKVKIEMQHKSEVERVSKESREKLNELLRDEDVQAMKNFKEQQIAPLNSSVEVLGTSLAGIRTAFNEIKDDIALSSKMKDDLDDVREENKRLKSALSQQESENTKLQTKVNQYESSVGQSLQKVDDYVANLNSAKSSDEASLKILVERNITLNEKVQQTEKELTKMQLELAKLQSTIESYETLTQESLDFFRDKGLEGDDIKDMLAQLGTKHQSQLQEAKDENKKQYENLKFRYDKGIQLLETLQKEHDEMTKQMEENQAVFEERDRLSQKVIDFRDKVKQLESTINALQAEKGRAEERCGEYLGQVQEMKTRCAQLEETITNLQSRVEARDNQDLKELKNDIKALGQHIKNGGRSDGVAESEVVAKVKEDLRACRQELDNTIVELQELRNKPQEHVEAAVQRYKAGTSTASEIRLHDWAEEGQKNDFADERRKFKNDMKSHLARIEKLEKDGATKDKEIEALRQSVSSASSKPATAPSIPQSPHLSTTPGIARSTAKEPNPKKRHLNLYPPTDKPNPPPASQKRLRVEKTQQDDDHYFDEINDSDLPDPAEYGKEATDKAKGKQLDVTMVLDGNDQSSELSEDELESTQPASSSQQPPHSQAVDTTKHRQGRPSNAKNAKFTTKASASKASTSRSKSIPDKENDDDDWTPPGEKGAKKGDKNDRKNGKK